MSCDDCIGFTYDDVTNCTNWTEGQAYTMWNDDIEVMSTGHAKSGVFEPPLPGPDGILRYYVTTRSPLRNQEGKIAGVFGISIDITNSYLMQKNFAKNLQLDIERSNKDQKKLAKRQTECLYYLVRGMTIKQIAKALNLSDRTVESYLEDLKVKLNCLNKSDLIAKAIEMGFGNIN